MSTCHASRILARTVVSMGVWWGQKEAVGCAQRVLGARTEQNTGWGMGTVRSHGRSQGSSWEGGVCLGPGVAPQTRVL